MKKEKNLIKTKKKKKLLHENRIYSHGEEENLVRIMKVNCNSGDVISQQTNGSQIYNNYCRYLNELY